MESLKTLNRDVRATGPRRARVLADVIIARFVSFSPAGHRRAHNLD